MYKNQLQELAQRSCFNLPSYTCIREGPDHAPRFKATVNFNGETFESPSYCCTLRQAEHSAAEVALNALAGRGPSNSLAARILDETGVYKNLLQEVSQRVGASLPNYSTFRSGLGHLPVFTCTVELARVIFTGDPAKNKKQAEKNAAMTAWFSLKSLLQNSEIFHEKPHKDEQEHMTVARALQHYLIKARLARVPFPIKFPTLSPRPASTPPSAPPTSKLLPMIWPKTAHQTRPISNSPAFQKYVRATQSQPATTVPDETCPSVMDILKLRPPQKLFPAAGASPYVPVQHCNPHSRIAPPVMIRDTVPVFSAPPLPPPQPSLTVRPPALAITSPISIKQAQAVPTFASPSIGIEELPLVRPPTKLDIPQLSRCTMARTEEPLIFRTLSGRLEESLVSKTQMARVEEALSFKIPNSDIPDVKFNLPSSEILAVPAKSPVSKVSIPLANSNSKAAGAGEASSTRNVMQEIEHLKKVKI